MGSSGPFAVAALIPVNNSSHVMKASIANPGFDFEYYITASVGDETVTDPVTGGHGVTSINKTVVIWPRD